MAEMKHSDVINKSEKLKSFWLPRVPKFEEWYKLIRMEDQLQQEKMESFVGNEPRAAYNLVLHMLDAKIPHRIPSEDLTVELVAAASQVEEIYSLAWHDIYSRHRRKGRQSWLRDLIGFLLATGWYSVFGMVSVDGTRCLAEVWNPASVFPSWDDELIECAHIDTLTPVGAKRMAARSGWELRQSSYAAEPRPKLYDYWWLDDGGGVWNAIVLQNTLVKPATYEPRFTRIPIFTSPVGGLPDTGVIYPGNVQGWKEEIGQSSIATNENIYKAWNKWWTFSMQLLRDTAQPRTFERSTSGKQIVNPQDWYRRGAHFRMGPQDEIGFVQPPAIPVELRSSQLDMEAMMQRGGPSWAMFGAVQQQLSAFVMSQIAASANQISKPYHQAVVDVLTDIDNLWLEQIRNFNYKPYGRALPPELPDDIKMSADYEIRIPGDLVNRATTARMLNPNFELSYIRVLEELFPDIKNPIEEKARIRADEAERHPVRATIALIESFRQEAEMLRAAGESRAAMLYEKAADRVEATLDLVEEEAGAPPTGRAAPGAPPGVIPPEARGAR